MQWKKGAIRLRPGNKYEMKQDGCKIQLQIHDLTCEDSGTYKCCSGSLATTASIVVKGENYEIIKSFSFVIKYLPPFGLNKMCEWITVIFRGQL